MAIQQTKKQSDLEKRLKLLRTQVYGKEKLDVRSEKLDIETRGLKLDQTSNFQPQSLTSNIQHPISDISYLYQDLLKIGIFSSLALGIQIILFFIERR